MNLPDLHLPAIISTVDSPTISIVSASAISADIRAVQCWYERELELVTIREFGENWDGRGSDAPTVAAMDAGSLFLRIWKETNYGNPPARIALSPNGLLSVDWLDGDELIRAEIQDLDSNEIEWMRAIPGQPTEFFTTALTDQTGSRTKQVRTWRPAPVTEGEPALACALSGSRTKQVQTWRPAPVTEDEPALACAL